MQDAGDQTRPDQTSHSGEQPRAHRGRGFGSVLVANRGEIAVRVLTAAREAGLRTVAVYSDADAHAPYVRLADTAVRLGPTPAAESYLSIPAILTAADRTGADAVHPGYGFLSERAEFARAVCDAGLTFIGPSADVIELMGRKDQARKVAEAAGVPVLPAVEVPTAAGLSGGSNAMASHPPDTLVEAVGLPLLVKAAAGGGGKGMRIVRTADELAEALASARREALAAFGDDTMLVERYVEHGRHVEVQVLGDAYGNVVHLFERDCSVQRRHQKVVEEAPAPTVSAELRARLTEAAVALAKQVDYVNAGTVEFLVAGEEFFFLEMNTRLQVEHPVTELVTGRDLVRLQLLVAQGRPLPFSQSEVSLDGHAVEVRVYAEDPDAGFLPQAGVASTVHWPERARVDAALEPGQQVGTAYDPMLGKVIVRGATREAARRALVNALDDTSVLGLTTNLGFLRRLVDSAEFRDATIDTAWLDRHPDAFPRRTSDLVWCLAAWAVARRLSQRASSGPFGVGDGWRLGGPPAAVPVELAVGDERRVLQVSPGGGSVREGDRMWTTRPVHGAGEQVLVEVDGSVVELRAEVDAHRVVVGVSGETFVFERPDAFGPVASGVAVDGTVVAPMPGTVLSVSVHPGDRVAEGQTLAVVEAMKMELAIKAPLAGRVGAVEVAAGQQVALRQRLFVVDGDA